MRKQMNHIIALLEDSRKEQVEELKPWMEKRLERALTPEEIKFVMETFLKPKLMKIFVEESSYLNNEEIAHRISMISKGLLDIPELIKLENSWSAQEKNLKSEEKISLFLDQHLLNT